VGQRTRELGIRAALGAGESSLVKLVVGEGARLALAGAALGMIGALVAARALRTLVFGVTTTDPLTYLILAGLIVGVALVATYIPARRAARADPVAALRSD
jgi:ABC-type antimicrobial peptide transport system permease subunit